MLIVTNFPSFPARWTSSCGRTGTAVYAASLTGFLRYSRDPGAVFLVNCKTDLMLTLSAALRLIPSRATLISIDLVLRQPHGVWAEMIQPLKRYLLSRGDHHIHYFREISGYRSFGITPDRSSFVPFKVNLRQRYELPDTPEGEYVLCFGRSMRDYDSFFAAMERVPFPGAIAQPDFAGLRQHHARFTRPLSKLPVNVSVLEDDGTEEAQIRILSRAKLVVLPILKTSLAASGISTCLNAMMLGKCVIGSEGPGMSDVFTDEALMVPPEDSDALAAMIRRAWEDHELRQSVARRGRSYATEAGGEAELYQRLIDRVAQWYGEHRPTGTLVRPS